MIDYARLESVARQLVAALNEDASRIATHIEFCPRGEEGVEVRISYRVDLRGEGFPNDIPAACVEKAIAVLREFGFEPLVGGRGVHCREEIQEAVPARLWE